MAHHDGRHALPTVAHTQSDISSGDVRRASEDRIGLDDDIGGVNAQGAAVGHGVAGVDGQVDQDLLDLARVGEDRQRIVTQRSAQLDICAKGSAEKVLDPAYPVVEVEHLGADNLSSGEGQKLVGQICSASSGLFDLVNISLRSSAPLHTLGRAVLGRLQLFSDEGSVVEYYSKQVIEVMGDTTSETTEDLEAFALNDLGLP
jgi:hypothetical protein